MENDELIKNMEEGLSFLKEALAKKDSTIARVMVGALGIYLSELSRNLDLPYIWTERKSEVSK